MSRVGRLVAAHLPLDARAFMVLVRLSSVPAAVAFAATSGNEDALPQMLGVLLGLVGAILADLRPHGTRTQTMAAIIDALVVAGAATVAQISPFGSYSPLGLLLVAGWGVRRGGRFGAVVGGLMAVPISAWYLIVPGAVDAAAVIGPIGTLPWLGLLVGWAAERQAAQEVQIRQQASQLALAHTELERFAGRVSHDLKNPLSAMVGFARLLADGRADPEVVSQHILRCSEDLMDQVEGLYVASVDPSAQLETRPVDLVELVLDAAADIGAGGELAVDVGDVPLVEADPRLLRLVVLNLLSNAVAHAGRAGGAVQVTVTGRAAGERVVVEVCDDGPGIDDAQQSQVLEHGVRGGDSAGSGLGLGTVATVVARHDGVLELGRSPAGGLKVTFDLAVAPGLA